MKRTRMVLAAYLGVGSLVVSGIFSGVAAADSLNVNFENPPYTIGSIDGQNGWDATGSAGDACGQSSPYDEGVSSSNGTPGFGQQSFRISNAVTSGCFGDQAFSKPLVNAVGETDATSGGYSTGTLQRHFQMQFQIASAKPNAQQQGLSISVSPDRGDGSRMSYLRFDDNSDGIDVTFYDVQGTTNPANFVPTVIATGLDRTKPHTVKLTLDALDGPSNDVVKVWIDGSLVHTGTSWENYYRYDSEASAEQTPRIIRNVLFRASGTAVPENAGGGFLFDNFSLSSGADPSPYPTSKAQCTNAGWKNFTNPSFKNLEQCEDWVNARAYGDLTLSGPKQQMEFNVTNNAADTTINRVVYQNFTYLGGLYYRASVTCSYVNPLTQQVRFMFQIPAGHPGLSGMYVVATAQHTKGKNTSELYGHEATADLATATQWCQTGTGFSPTMYTVTKGNVDVDEW